MSGRFISSYKVVLPATATFAVLGGLTFLPSQRRDVLDPDTKTDVLKIQHDMQAVCDAGLVQFIERTSFCGATVMSEAKFAVAKSYAASFVKGLDVRELTEDEMLAIEVFREEMVPKIRAAGIGPKESETLKKLNITGSVYGVVCEAVLAHPALKSINTRFTKTLCAKILKGAVAKTEQAYRAKFKNMSLDEAAECVQQAAAESWEQNLMSALNPQIFGNYNSSTVYSTGYDAVFVPGKTLNFQSVFNTELNWCIAAKNQEIVARNRPGRPPAPRPAPTPAPRPVAPSNPPVIQSAPPPAQAPNQSHQKWDGGTLEKHDKTVDKPSVDKPAAEKPAPEKPPKEPKGTDRAPGLTQMDLHRLLGSERAYA